MLNNASTKAVIKNFSQNQNCRKEMLDIVNNVITNEIKEISKNDCELFKEHASNSEKLTFDWGCKSQLLQQKAPYLFSVFSNAVCLREKQQNLPQMLTALAVLLYGRSQNMNQLQYILGFNLQKCGFNREVIDVLCFQCFCINTYGGYIGLIMFIHMSHFNITKVAQVKNTVISN